MATTPTAAQTPATGFQPALKRVAQTNDFDCWLACIAMIVNRPLGDDTPLFDVFAGLERQISMDVRGLITTCHRAAV